MKGRTILTLAAGAGLWLGSTVNGADTPKAKKATAAVSNQTLADEVARRIRASGAAEGASVQIKVEKGRVELAGTALSLNQQQEIAKVAIGVDGVSEVVLLMKSTTKLEQAEAARVQQAQAVEPPMQMPLNPPAPPAAPMMMPGMAGPGMMPGMGGPSGGYPQDPVPLAGPGQAGYDPYGPKLPGYAWPTYAPYNNVSRVAYPQAYPYNAFPYIGPFYPFPKVPLGWRTVQLSWDDGHWYLGRVSTPHDYWRVRFW